MLRNSFVAALLLMAATAGCFGSEDSGPQETGDSPSPTGGNETGAFTVTMLDYPTTAGANETINVTWQVETEGDATTPLTHTGLHYGNESVPEVNESNPDPYPNSAGEQDVATAPGTFNASFMVEAPGVVYMRAHASVGGNVSWSDEVQIEVTVGGAGNGTGQVHTVDITNGLLPHLSTYNPRNLQVKVGDSVQWKNGDDAAHTATSTNGSFDTGSIPAGNVSKAIVFSTAGTFSYRCSNHPMTMTGSIVVEA